MDAQKKRNNNDAVRRSRERKKNKIEERKKAKNDLEARINELTVTLQNLIFSKFILKYRNFYLDLNFVI